MHISSSPVFPVDQDFISFRSEPSSPPSSTNRAEVCKYKRFKEGSFAKLEIQLSEFDQGQAKGELCCNVR